MYFTPKVADLPVVREQQRISPVTRIDIPKVGISLPVYRTIITNKTWGIAADGVSHLSESSNPGQEGPIILYAHNTRDRFGPIRWLNDGDIITLTTEDAKQHTYKIVERIKTSPDELSVFFKRKTETLYLFTCDGFADIDRYIVVAQPIASDSAR